MVTEKVLKEQFQLLGCNVENDAVLQKCIDLCIEFEKSEEQLVEMWVAFSVPKFGNMDLTLEGLQQMERTERVGFKVEKPVQTRTTYKTPSSSNITDDDEILLMYGYKTPVTPKIKRLRSPDLGSSGPENKLFAVENPSSLSPITPSRYSTKLGPGRVLVSFGEKLTSWKIEKHFQITIKQTEDIQVPSDARYMFDVITDAAIQRAIASMKLGKELCKKWSKIQEDKLVCTSDVKSVFQTNFVTWGRVRCDMQGKLNKVSTELEGIHTYHDLIEGVRIKSSIVPVDLSNVQEFSVFPGQIIAVEGKNVTGNLLEAKNIFSNGYPPASEAFVLKNDIYITVAAGPFTTINDLNYDPLINLLERIKEEEPHVLILIGPFVEYSHPQITSVLNRISYQDLFEKTIRTVMESLKGKCTQVVIISSSRDAHHEPVYPTPQYYLPRSLENPNLHFMPDPCTLNIEGLIIGITAIDILKHLGNEELSSNSFKTGKLIRLANHILSQACFYPLYPPAEEVNIDTQLWKTYTFMKKQPHILILPSDMAYFCKPINGCVVINPERLCKNSFARMRISASMEQKWNENCIACEILKV